MHFIFYLLIRITFNDLGGAWQRADVTTGLTQILAVGFFLHWACCSLAWERPVTCFLRRCWKAASSWTSGVAGQSSAANFTAGAKDKAEVALTGLGSSSRSVNSVRLDRRGSPQAESVLSVRGSSPAVCKSEITMPNAASMSLWYVCRIYIGFFPEILVYF